LANEILYEPRLAGVHSTGQRREEEGEERDGTVIGTVSYGDRLSTRLNPRVHRLRYERERLRIDAVADLRLLWYRRLRNQRRRLRLSRLRDSHPPVCDLPQAEQPLRVSRLRVHGAV